VVHDAELDQVALCICLLELGAYLSAANAQDSYEGVPKRILCILRDEQAMYCAWDSLALSFPPGEERFQASHQIVSKTASAPPHPPRSPTRNGAEAFRFLPGTLSVLPGCIVAGANRRPYVTAPAMSQCPPAPPSRPRESRRGVCVSPLTEKTDRRRTNRCGADGESMCSRDRELLRWQRTTSRGPSVFMSPSPRFVRRLRKIVLGHLKFQGSRAWACLACYAAHVRTNPPATTLERI
jgi:hypothetical protein